jgi:hypothetical protein
MNLKRELDFVIGKEQMAPLYYEKKHEKKFEKEVLAVGVHVPPPYSFPLELPFSQSQLL